MARTATLKKPAGALGDIEQLAERYSEARHDLVKRMTALDERLRALKRQHIEAIKLAAADAKDARAELEAALKSHPEEFEKPKTRVFHGIRVGFRKLVGTIAWDDPAQVVKLIKKHFSDQADVLIKTTETPVKDALAQLPANDLAKLGVSLQDPVDEVVIKSVDGEIDKLVDALLKDAEESTD